MYELVQAGENTYYIDCPAKMGLYVTGSSVCMIDGGSDGDAAKKALKHIEARGWHLDMVINTHSHADHIGGNQLLQNRTGCRIYAYGIERAFAERPELEGTMLYGAEAPEPFRHKAYRAKPSVVGALTEAVLPKGLEIIELPGHSIDQIGIRTSDDVVFLADALLGDNILEKYSFSVIIDAAKYLETLGKIENMEAELFVPSHGQPTADIKSLAELNIRTTEEIIEMTYQICREPRTFEEIVKLLFDRYGTPDTVPQYYLNSTTVKAILTMLADQGRLESGTAEHMTKFNSI